VTLLSSIKSRRAAFEFVSGQLNAMQRFMHPKFDAIDKRFDAVDVP
jgi:hypothetical protein